MNTYDLFNIKTWQAFSNKGKIKTEKEMAVSNDQVSSSLEAVHDEVHNLIGHFGHFSSGCAGMKFQSHILGS